MVGLVVITAPRERPAALRVPQCHAEHGLR